MKSGLCSATTLSGSALFPLSSRPERSVVERSAVVSAHAMKRGLCSATTLSGSAPLPFVISTGAQRSGEICGRLGPRDENGGSLLTQDFAGDDQTLDLAGSLTDGAELYVAVELFYWIVLDEAVASVHLHCFIAHLHRNFAGHQLGHR